MPSFTSPVLALLLLQTSATTSKDSDVMASSEGLGTSMTYDEETDRIYVTGDRDDDCWLGILQLPVHGTDATWIKNVNLGMEDQTESCTSVQTCRTGNSRQLFVTGISFGGSSLLRSGNARTPDDAAKDAGYQRTSGWLWDVAWYGEVKGGYSRPQHVPTSMAASCENDVYITWLYGDGRVRLTRIGRSPLHASDIMTTNQHETFRDENITMSTVATLATMNNPDAESYDQYMYLQQPWSERWTKDVPDGSAVTLVDDHLMLITGNSLMAIDMESGIFRRELHLGRRLNTACHAADSGYMYVLAHPSIDDEQAIVSCVETESLTVAWSRNLSWVDASSCAVTPDDQRLYISGGFGLVQLETSSGEEMWMTQKIPISAVVSDRFGNAVILGNELGSDTVRFHLVERQTGRLQGGATSFDDTRSFLAFLGGRRLYILSSMTVVILSILVAILLFARKRKRCTRTTVEMEPFGMGSQRKDKRSCERRKDMDPLLRCTNRIV